MPRRSRGCAACRQRRIGCDGGLPSCRQCLITNRQCSGPRLGVLIIDQTEHVVAKNRPRPRLTRNQDLSIYRPSDQSIFAHAFINEFVSFITARNEYARRQSWLTELQRGSIVDEGTALELSMQATALAYCGAASNNLAAVREARDVYGRALANHSKSIAHDLTSRRAASLCTCVMLSMFEAICSTNPLAYGTHLRAAQKMLMLIPQDAGDVHSQVAQQLGQHVKCQTLFVMITSPEEYIAAGPAPRTWTPERHNSDDVVGRLIENVVYLTEVLIRKSYNLDDQPVLSPFLELETHDLWDEFQEQSGNPIQKPTFPEVQHQDPFVTMIVAYFAASWALLRILKAELSERELPLLEDSFQDILHCSQVLEGKNLGCAHLRMFFPLVFAGMYSRSKQQQALARKILRRWLQTTAFRGMGWNAYQRVQTRNTLGVR